MIFLNAKFFFLYFLNRLIYNMIRALSLNANDYALSNNQ